MGRILPHFYKSLCKNWTEDRLEITWTFVKMQEAALRNYIDLWKKTERKVMKMASINGIKMKAYKTFRGHEGEPLAQANIYAGTKNIGFWSQDSWGGPDNYDGRDMYDTIKASAEKFQTGVPKSAEYYDFTGDADIFMDVLLRLRDDEKAYKQNLKKGYDRTLVITDGYNYIRFGCRGVNTPEEFEKRWSDTVAKAKKQMFKNKTIYIYMLVSLDDFNITVDENHPAKEWMYK